LRSLGRGLAIDEVAAGGLAAAAGLRAGDVIREMAELRFLLRSTAKAHGCSPNPPAKM
jgi:hypothetical protein